jgi:Tol biopolymer transport system component
MHGEYILFRMTSGWWLIRIDGSNKHKVADDYTHPQLSPGPSAFARWAHDGSVVHFVRWDDSHDCLPQIIDVPPSGGSGTVVPAALVGDDANFVWSPDGSQIAFTRSEMYRHCMHTSYGIDDKRDLMLMDADGSHMHTVATDVAYSPSGWMPDGSAILGDTETGLVRVSVTTGAATPIVSAISTLAQVSPDGAHVAYWDSGQLRVANIDGTGSVPLGPASSVAYSFAWAPNGHSLAVLRDVTVGGTTHRRPFAVAYPGGTALGFTQDGDSPSWNLDSIHFVCSSSTTAMIYTAIGSGSFTFVPNTTGALAVYWQP